LEKPVTWQRVRDSLLDYAGRVSGGSYPENRPYLLPETLGELTGPVVGMVQLALRLDWTERVEFHLDDPAERNVMYERVIREATRPEDLRSYLNGTVLRETWRQLFLPARVRRIWEERFPALRLSA
jgi:hypothetical protein